MIEKKQAFSPVTESLTEVMAMVEGVMDVSGVPFDIAMRICVVVDEVFTNIALYSGAALAEVSVRCTEDAVHLCFQDDGMPFDPLKAKEPDATLGAQERNLGGLGIFLMKSMMDSVEYRYENGKNQLTVMKLLKPVISSIS